MTTYTEIEGHPIKSNKLQHKFSKRIFNAISYLDPLIKLVEIRKNKQKDILILDFDLNIPNRRKIKIEPIELIGIVIKDGKSLPKVYALRHDFPLNLSHTNVSSKLRPVDLCLYEESFEEVMLKWSGIEFLTKIKSWLELTAKNKLHQDDQPLEPYFVSNGIIIYNRETQSNAYLIVKVTDNVYKLHSRESSKVDSYLNNSQAYLIKVINHDIQHGLVNIAPANLHALINELNRINVCLISKLRELIDEILDNPDLTQLIELPPVIILELDLQRDENTESEQRSTYFFKINTPLSELGMKLNYLVFNNDKYSKVEDAIFSPTQIMDIEVEVLSPHQDFSYLFSQSLNDNLNTDIQFTLIGVGALGSQFLNNMTRKGYGKWNIIDNDIILPHNLARHQANRFGIGKSKVEFMSEYINQAVYPSENIVKPYKLDFLKSPKEIKKPILESDYIIDISTSISVERYLASNFQEKRKFSAFLNPNGNDLVLLSEGRTTTSLDLIEFQYYKELINDERLYNHFDFPEHSKVRYARGCRDITSKVSQDNLSVFSGILSKAISNRVNSNSGAIDIWKLENDFSISNLNYQLDDWRIVEIDNWNVFLNEKLLKTIYDFRKSKLPNETGGIIIGGVDTYNKRIYITDTILSPKDSIEKRTLYIRGIEGVEHQLKTIKERTNDSLYYLGEWHSHPNGYSLKMSNDDEVSFCELINEAQLRGLPTLMLIFGKEEFSLHIGNHEF